MAIIIDSFKTATLANKALRKMPHDPAVGCMGVNKNGTSGMFEIVQFPVNKPGVDTSCVDCGAATHIHGRCPREAF